MWQRISCTCARQLAAGSRCFTLDCTAWVARPEQSKYLSWTHIASAADGARVPTISIRADCVREATDIGTQIRQMTQGDCKQRLPVLSEPPEYCEGLDHAVRQKSQRLTFLRLLRPPSCALQSDLLSPLLP